MDSDVKTSKSSMKQDGRRVVGDTFHRPSGSLLGLIAGAKDAVLDEFKAALPSDDRLIRLAVNEAEALAWQTEFPHLVFPALAREKAEHLAAWRARQRRVRPPEFQPSFAA